MRWLKCKYFDYDLSLYNWSNCNKKDLTCKLVIFVTCSLPCAEDCEWVLTEADAIVIKGGLPPCQMCVFVIFRMRIGDDAMSTNI